MELRGDVFDSGRNVLFYVFKLRFHMSSLIIEKKE